MENFGKIILHNLVKREFDKKRSFTFQLKQNKKNFLISQKVPKKLKNFLEHRYKWSEEENTNQMSASNHRRKHGDRFLKYLKKNFKENFLGKEILEIGCGSGYMLKELKKAGALVTGVESSLKHRNKELNIINDFFIW